MIQDNFRFLGGLARQREHSDDVTFNWLEAAGINYALGAGGIGIYDLWCAPEDYPAVLDYLGTHRGNEPPDFFAAAGNQVGMTYGESCARARARTRAHKEFARRQSEGRGTDDDLE